MINIIRLILFNTVVILFDTGSDINIILLKEVLIPKLKREYILVRIITGGGVITATACGDIEIILEYKDLPNG